MSDWWAITVTVAAALLIGWVLSWAGNLLQAFLGGG